MTAQARTGTSGDGALSINQDHRTRELWWKASEQLPDNRRGEEGRVETHKNELQDSVDWRCNCVLKQRLRQIRKLMLGLGKLARKNVERRSSLALAQLHVTKPRGSKRLRAVLAADLFVFTPLELTSASSTCAKVKTHMNSHPSCSTMWQTSPESAKWILALGYLWWNIGWKRFSTQSVNDWPLLTETVIMG